jgi:hypothetical protein
MSTENGDEPAFPPCLSHETVTVIGLTKREWMSAMCLGAMVEKNYDFDTAAQEAVQYADALLAELSRATV